MKYFGLAAAALMMTISASAGTINGNCTVTPANTTTGTGSITCAQFNVSGLTGDTFSIAVDTFDSFSQGPNNVLVYTFTYGFSEPDLDMTLAGTPNTCANSGAAGGAASCTDAVSGTFVGASGVYQLGATILGSDVDFASVYTSLTPTTWAVGTVSGTISSGGPGASGFSAGAQVSEVLTYTSAAPEPGSMMLLGGGLLAAGLIGRKKLAARK